MFGAHIPELAIVLVLALVFFGPKRLPEIGGAVGKGIREFRKGTQDLTGNDHTVHPAADPTQIASHPVQRDVSVAPEEAPVSAGTHTDEKR